MTREEKEIKSPSSGAHDDPIGATVGDFGAWQLRRVVLVFLLSLPGLCHIYMVVFGTAKSDFYCKDEYQEVCTYRHSRNL